MNMTDFLSQSYDLWLKAVQTKYFGPGVVARSEACPLGIQAAPEFDPHVWHILSWRLGPEKISAAILPLPLSCQLLAKECALSTGKFPRRLAQKQYG